MKYALTFFATLFVVGVTALPIDESELTDLERDFVDFYNLLDPVKLHRIALDHVSDLEIYRSLNYMKSEEFQNLLYAVEELPEFEKFVLYLNEAGFPIVKGLEYFHKFFSMKPYVPPNVSSQRFVRKAGQGGLSGYVNDLIAILPLKEIRELHEKKLKESPAFAKYSEYVRSDKYAEMVMDLAAQKPFLKFYEKSLEHGIDIALYRGLEMRLLGFF